MRLRSISLLAAALVAGAVVVWWRIRAPEPFAAPDFPAAAARTAAPAAGTALPVEPVPATPRLESLASASREDWLAALRDRLAAGASAEEILAALQWLARTRPTTALDLARLLARSDEERHDWVTALVQAWAARDPAAAWTWALEPLHGRDLQGEPPLLQAALSGVAAADPALARTLADTALRTATGGAEMARAAVEALLGAGQAPLAREMVEAWARDTKTDLKLDNAVFERVALEWAEQARGEAAAWLRGLPRTEARDLALATLAAEWSEQAPAEAMQWAAGLESDGGRADALQRVFNRWATQDQVAAAQWLAENESHPSADALIANLVGDSSLSENNPQLALRWAGLITDANERRRQVEAVLSQWGSRDLPSAMHYIVSTSELTPAQKETLLQRLQARAAVNPEW